ncbi:MAG: YbhB/YbcL family Raf kinase inhibitor-like protein [Bryobacteraceae bacterium]|nr:YbhB/YbcL family Raf kinase inhibitor-like protein [Bryobacteraceae bacterium]
MAFQLTSSAFPEGGNIPIIHTCDGTNVSPPLAWSGEPEGVKSFALIVEDPDAPSRTWTHWLLYDIPAEVHELEQGFQPGRLGMSGSNDFGKLGYGGPCPPKGHGPHRYFFRLFALNVPSLGLRDGENRVGVELAIRGHVLGEAQCMGRYERK